MGSFPTPSWRAFGFANLMHGRVELRFVRVKSSSDTGLYAVLLFPCAAVVVDVESAEPMSREQAKRAPDPRCSHALAFARLSRFGELVQALYTLQFSADDQNQVQLHETHSLFAASTHRQNLSSCVEVDSQYGTP